MTQQPDLFSPAATAATLPDGVTPADQADLRAALIAAGGLYLTRKELCQRLGWPDRKLRAVAQSLGGDIVRCQLGFKLRVACTRDDQPYIIQAADAAGSQARIQLAYELEMRRLAHTLAG